MVNIDTVYQKVLAFANKEQRGYITPQEFNLYANQAQIEIYEQYYYDLNNFEMRDAAYNLNSDTTTLTRQKLDLFMLVDGGGTINAYVTSGNGKVLPDYIYRLSRVELDNIEAEYLDNNRFKDAITSGPLVKPSALHPVYTVRDSVVLVNGGSFANSTRIEFYRLPATVSWGYFVVGNKALHDNSLLKTTHFELHAAEESELVYRILAFAGISMQKPNLAQSAVNLETAKVKQEKQ
tara:strand:- start:938 stop:1645 length:708 start_codon:yes stop_codon:yes gene_type:complete